ncbi:nascent polypeptide-associated complex protein [Halobellus ruber]|uniref:Nascent polypeptide-associated complex protein n=1 Tax=Halobellus ruber TaxID=2761102 RepID=A0A7J9SHY4_9EURY|nr:nascent polypeptide-associated complex protein [Halobellus ruber]MBB6645973.1 nascent polypeptide-associated complex protein [Halobellus ruber]
MFGGGGMNPRKMKQMMEQMGIDVTELDVEEVVIRTGDEDLVFEDAQVTRMDAQGQQTYQVVGEPESREPSAAAIEGGDGDAGDDADDGIPEDDVALVAENAGVDAETAREALAETDGDLAAAIAKLE